MTQDISLGYRRLLEAANGRIESVDASDALALHGAPEVVFVDLRDPRELEREGKIPGAFHCPRGMLEFWIDPESPYHKPVFASDKRFVFYCASGWRSALSTDTAQSMGLKPVAHIAGGLKAWKDAGGPVEAVDRKRDAIDQTSLLFQTPSLRDTAPSSSERSERMSGLTLVIGNKSYSSWSLRPWLLMREFGVPFDEIVIPLYREGSADAVRAHSPTGKVPCLLDGTMRIWESLAIIEHLAERFPDRPIWPQNPEARAFARSISAEMHAGFAALREEFTMNIRRKVEGRSPSAAARADVARIEEIWREARERFGAGGPYLFGAFSAADAMYAPVATRFDTYGLEIGPEAQAYVETILSTPAYVEWKEAALAEPWVIEAYEPG